MPAAVASRNPKHSRPGRDSAPPAKKAKLSQPPAPARQNGLRGLINGTAAQPTAKANGAKDSRKDRVQDATLVVGAGDIAMEDPGNEVIHIGSAGDESEEQSDQDESEGSVQDASHDEGAAPAVNGHAEHPDPVVDEEIADPEELSFGDRLRAQEPESTRESRIVDVETAFADADDSKALAPTFQKGTLFIPSPNSLGTVLTQALRTNDQNLLESCFAFTDVDGIYGTIERLPSPLVGNLLQKLAERLHKKPGRAGMLMVWVQWSLAAHGGYLASQPQLVKQLATLNKVLKERANGLQPLLSLKGRLDMLQAQLELRRRNQRRATNDEEDEAVIYVEGQDDYASSEEEDAVTASQKQLREESDDEDESSIDEMPTTMEVDEDSEEGSDDSNDLLDDEAEETDLDTGDEMSEPMSDDLEDGEEDLKSEEETKPARRSTAARAGLKTRR